MQKILVTGANGYIGRHVIEELLNKGHTVYACDIKIDGFDHRVNKKCISIFNDDKDIYKNLGSPDVCIHLAWKGGLMLNSDTNIEDLFNHYVFIRNMISGGLKHLSVIGTMHEIGNYEGVIDENTPTNPSSLFGIAKNCLRQLVEILAKENDVIFQWLRAYYIIGDDLKSNSIFSKIVKMKTEGKDNFPISVGRNKYDFISIEELAKQIVAASLQTEVCGIINCCSGKPVSLSEKIEEFIEENDLKIKLNYEENPASEDDAPAVWGDNSKILRILEKES